MKQAVERFCRRGEGGCGVRWYSLWSVGRPVAESWLGLFDALSRLQVKGAVSGCKKVAGRERERGKASVGSDCG